MDEEKKPDFEKTAELLAPFAYSEKSGALLVYVDAHGNGAVRGPSGDNPAHNKLLFYSLFCMVLEAFVRMTFQGMMQEMVAQRMSQVDPRTLAEMQKKFRLAGS